MDKLKKVFLAILSFLWKQLRKLGAFLWKQSKRQTKKTWKAFKKSPVKTMKRFGVAMVVMALLLAALA